MCICTIYSTLILEYSSGRGKLVLHYYVEALRLNHPQQKPLNPNYRCSGWRGVDFKVTVVIPLGSPGGQKAVTSGRGLDVECSAHLHVIYISCLFRL